MAILAFVGILSVSMFLVPLGGMSLLQGSVSQGDDVIPHTPAGVNVLEEALQGHRLKEAKGRVMGHSAALRFCAVHGMKRVSRLRSSWGSRKESGYLDAMMKRDLRPSGGSVANEKSFLWDDVCGLIKFCTNDRFMSRESGGSGGSDGGNGGGGE